MSYIVANPHDVPEGVHVISLEHEGQEPVLLMPGQSFDQSLVSAEVLTEFLAEQVVVDDQPGSQPEPPAPVEAAAPETVVVEPEAANG